MTENSEAIDEELLDSILRKSLEELEKEAPLSKETLPIFPLTRRPFFPATGAAIVLEPGPLLEMVKQALKSEHQRIALLLTKTEEIKLDKVQPSDLMPFGVMARVNRLIPLDNGNTQVNLSVEKRILLQEINRYKKTLKGHFEYVEEPKVFSKKLKAYAVSIISTIKELLKLTPLFKEELQIFLSHSDVDDPGKLADLAAALTTGTREELQEVLETMDVQKRVDLALLLLKKELDLSQLQNSINKKIEGAISKNQREFFLREQLKTIKRELGIEKDDKAIERQKFESRLKKRIVPEDVMNVIQEELEKLSSLEPHSSEYGVCRGYLDWLTNIPWGIKGKENHDLKKAEEILNKDHFGLEDVKLRILEFMSVSKLAGGVQGNILCLVGPPGVGKTSIGKSIARALNRKFYRFSVGGMRDEAEVKGHRRTYIGAMPGKLVQALKLCQTMNPVILIDEVDKISHQGHGDPSSALLEVLDPEQNREFLDHYLDVRCDLSQVLFILTANVLDTIPDALRDRMEIIRLSGYIQEEKVAIAEKYLIPKHRKAMGLKSGDITIGKDVLPAIINGYARESGVRSLENYLKQILRKTAHEIVKSSTSKKAQVSIDNLKDFIGKPLHTSDRFYPENPVGVATGLAWTSMGGATLYIEAITAPAEKSSMKLTGQAGDVMKESSEIAWSYLQSALSRYAPQRAFFDKQHVHIHIPEGATPKDGPSAGITMTTALLSQLLNRPIRHDLGMTGELTLTGRVLPIGGVKEKVVAAKRSSLKTLIFPRENERDIEELPSHLKEGLEIHFVNHYDQVYPIAFPEE